MELSSGDTFLPRVTAELGVAAAHDPERRRVHLAALWKMRIEVFRWAAQLIDLTVSQKKPSLFFAR